MLTGYVETNIASSLAPHDLRAVFQLRHEVFKGRLDWQVKCQDGLEYDEFDELDPVFLLSRNNASSIEGCCRLLPTTNKYMLADIFPELLCGEPAPKNPAIWEWSRFALAPTTSKPEVVPVNLNDMTVSILRAAFEFALENNVSDFVFVTTVAVERMLARLGLPIRRFGNGKATKLGKVLSVALWLPINEQYQKAVHYQPSLRKVA